MMAREGTNPFPLQYYNAPICPNAVWLKGQLYGFRCTECERVDVVMWGDTCDNCRSEEAHTRTVNEVIKEFTDIYETTIEMEAA